jgi:hypothetical protein
MVLANHATILLAVSCDICHSNGSTGTLFLLFLIAIPHHNNNNYYYYYDQNTIQRKEKKNPKIGIGEKERKGKRERSTRCLIDGREGRE